jgi:hypothetical protein
MQQPKLTRHARQRLQQRGVRQKEVVIVIAHGDIEVPAGNGCRFLRLSDAAAASLLQAGTYPVQDVDRSRRLMVLLSSTDEVVTVLKHDPERRFPGRREHRR